MILTEFKSPAKRQIFRLSVEAIYFGLGCHRIALDHAAEAQPVNLKKEIKCVLVTIF